MAIRPRIHYRLNDYHYKLGALPLPKSRLSLEAFAADSDWRQRGKQSQKHVFETRNEGFGPARYQSKRGERVCGKRFRIIMTSARPFILLRDCRYWKGWQVNWSALGLVWGLLIGLVDWNGKLWWELGRVRGLSNMLFGSLWDCDCCFGRWSDRWSGGRGVSY